MRTKNLTQSSSVKAYSIGEEIFNSISHGIGALLSVVALVLLVARAVSISNVTSSSTTLTIGSAIFGVSLIILYTMSTLYHAITPEKAKKIFAIFDHSCIFLLIAGTYTPYCLSILGGKLGLAIFIAEWTLAILGISLYAVFGSKIKIASVVMYILMGWLIIVAFKPLTTKLSSLSLALLLIGGAVYTIGCVFYALKKIKWMHCVWHIFVLGGSVLHFFSVYIAMKTM